jgi:AcrR family transcriptional regulator
VGADKSAASQAVEAARARWTGEAAQRQQQRPGTILDVARGQFALRGFEATTMRDIADASGITASNLYRYFDSKDSMLMEILGNFSDQLLDAYREVLQAGSPVVDTLDAILWLLDHAGRHFSREIDILPGFSRLLPPAVANRYGKGAQARFSMLTDLIDAGVQLTFMHRAVAESAQLVADRTGRRRVTGAGERSAATRGAYRAPVLGVRPGRHQRSRDVALRDRVSDVLMHPRPPLMQFACVLSREHGQLRVTRLDDIEQAPVDRPQHRVTAQGGDLSVELQIAAIEVRRVGRRLQFTHRAVHACQRGRRVRCLSRTADHRGFEDVPDLQGVRDLNLGTRDLHDAARQPQAHAGFGNEHPAIRSGPRHD